LLPALRVGESSGDKFMELTETVIWPSLPLDAWRETYRTLHMWTQIVGKVRLALTPRINHWWNSTLYVTPRGLTTSSIPHDTRSFEIAFDLLEGAVRIEVSDGARRSIPLASRSVAQFYSALTAALAQLGLETTIWPVPCELDDPVRFTLDDRGEYDAEAARRFWRVLTSVDRVLDEFRAEFIGKCSPVHFFWGSFDLAVTRFSGRRAPPRPDADMVTREAYSHECCSAGFWPGSKSVQGPAFYSYTAPQPEGFDAARIGPAGAFYDSEFGEFIYMYDDMRNAPNPREALLEFLRSTYAAGATLANWDRTSLERRHDMRTLANK
jgi:hypothetical protein